MTRRGTYQRISGRVQVIAQTVSPSPRVWLGETRPSDDAMTAAVRISNPTEEQRDRLRRQRETAWRMAERWTGYLWGPRDFTRTVEAYCRTWAKSTPFRPRPAGPFDLTRLDPDTLAPVETVAGVQLVVGSLRLPSAGVWRWGTFADEDAPDFATRQRDTMIGDPDCSDDVQEAILRIVSWLFAGSLPVPSPQDGAALTRAGILQKSGAAEILRGWKEPGL